MLRRGESFLLHPYLPSPSPSNPTPRPKPPTKVTSTNQHHLSPPKKAIPQPPYKGPGTTNWFSTPLYPENNADAVQVALKQASNNQISYPAKNRTTYEQGVTPGKDKLAGLHTPVTDWKAGDATPAWQPVAGGKGFGKPSGTATGTNATVGGMNGTVSSRRL